MNTNTCITVYELSDDDLIEEIVSVNTLTQCHVCKCFHDPGLCAAQLPLVMVASDGRREWGGE